MNKEGYSNKVFDMTSVFGVENLVMTYEGLLEPWLLSYYGFLFLVKFAIKSHGFMFILARKKIILNGKSWNYGIIVTI